MTPLGNRFRLKLNSNSIANDYVSSPDLESKKKKRKDFKK
jgi:hypothetical protein